jgi:hypothetical protein
MRNPYIHLLSNIADKHDRDYITPEDVAELRASEPEKVQWAVLNAIAYRMPMEDAALCAFVAVDPDWKPLED